MNWLKIYCNVIKNFAEEYKLCQNVSCHTVQVPGRFVALVNSRIFFPTWQIDLALVIAKMLGIWQRK